VLVAERSGVVKKVGEVESHDVTAGVATRVQLLIGSDDGAPNYSLKRFVMGDGGGMPRHANRIEHVQFVLRGRARVGIGDRVHEVGPESVLYIPAGLPHFYDVVEAPFEFLCIVPNAEDRVEILDDKELR
jgi:quercetin dioxygenase-like cupin family protein